MLIPNTLYSIPYTTVALSYISFGITMYFLILICKYIILNIIYKVFAVCNTELMPERGGSIRGSQTRKLPDIVEFENRWNYCLSVIDFLLAILLASVEPLSLSGYNTDLLH